MIPQLSSIERHQRETVRLKVAVKIVRILCLQSRRALSEIHFVVVARTHNLEHSVASSLKKAFSAEVNKFWRFV